ncbi:MAG TPA: hypothetical protein VN628_14380, partial [Vicinamibacterales bacterium]|nr:hypothetical protein [Vicinamibacterales bacterium]
RELAGLRAMMSEAAIDSDVPEPSPLFWNHLSSRVHDAVADEGGRPAFWFGWLGRPRVLVPMFAAALAMLVAVVLLPRAPFDTPSTIPSTPLPVADATLPASTPSLPPIAPLGRADDPQLRIVTAGATSAAWDEMMDEVAMATAGSSDAVAAALTADEQRELQRLLTQEVAQASAQEKRS